MKMGVIPIWLKPKKDIIAEGTKVLLCQKRGVEISLKKQALKRENCLTMTRRRKNLRFSRA